LPRGRREPDPRPRRDGRGAAERVRPDAGPRRGRRALRRRRGRARARGGDAGGVLGGGLKVTGLEVAGLEVTGLKTFDLRPSTFDLRPSTFDAQTCTPLVHQPVAPMSVVPPPTSSPYVAEQPKVSAYEIATANFDRAADLLGLSDEW